MFKFIQFNNKFKKSSGAVLHEFALVVPLLMLFLIGIVETSRIISNIPMVAQAVYQSALVGGETQENAGIAVMNGQVNKFFEIQDHALNSQTVNAVYNNENNTVFVEVTANLNAVYESFPLSLKVGAVGPNMLAFDGMPDTTGFANGNNYYNCEGSPVAYPIADSSCDPNATLPADNPPSAPMLTTLPDGGVSLNPTTTEINTTINIILNHLYNNQENQETLTTNDIILNTYPGVSSQNLSYYYSDSYETFNAKLGMLFYDSTQGDNYALLNKIVDLLIMSGNLSNSTWNSDNVKFCLEDQKNCLLTSEEWYCLNYSADCGHSKDTTCITEPDKCSLDQSSWKICLVDPDACGKATGVDSGKGTGTDTGTGTGSGK